MWQGLAVLPDRVPIHPPPIAGCAGGFSESASAPTNQQKPLSLNAPRSYLQRRRDQRGPYFTYEVIVVDDGSQDATVG